MNNVTKRDSTVDPLSITFEDLEKAVGSPSPSWLAATFALAQNPSSKQVLR
jgi:hypothetical protein